MQKKKNVLLFMPGTVGGSQRVMIALTKFLDPDKYKVKVFVIEKRLGGIENFVPKKWDIELLKIHNIFDFPITRMIRVIKREKADFLFSSIYYLNLRVLIASKLTGVPAILRSDNYVEVLTPIQKSFVKHIYKWAKVAIMQQEEMCEEFLKTFPSFPREKIIVIHNPIDTDAIEKLTNVPSPYPQENNINYVWVARFHPTKGQDVLAKAFVMMHNRMPNAHLYFIGRFQDLVFTDYVKNIVETAGLLDYVHFIGFDSNPYKWIKYCDCFVLPSRLEGLPNALVEAMYMKRPVVCTTCIDIIKRMVQDGHNGYLVPSEDVDAMTEAMLKAVELKDFEMTYKPGQPEEFRILFE